MARSPAGVTGIPWEKSWPCDLQRLDQCMWEIESIGQIYQLWCLKGLLEFIKSSWKSRLVAGIQPHQEKLASSALIYKRFIGDCCRFALKEFTLCMWTGPGSSWGTSHFGITTEVNGSLHWNFSLKCYWWALSQTSLHMVLPSVLVRNEMNLSLWLWTIGAIAWHTTWGFATTTRKLHVSRCIKCMSDLGQGSEPKQFKFKMKMNHF